jgi:hypothetical protein
LAAAHSAVACVLALLAAACQGAHACIAASWIGGVSGCQLSSMPFVHAELLYLQASEQKSAIEPDKSTKDLHVCTACNAIFSPKTHRLMLTKTPQPNEALLDKGW